MKVLMICIGLPTKENPSRGVFNLRTATQIKQVCDIELVFLRTWKPSKSIHKTYFNNGIKITELYLPYIPFAPYIFNVWLAQKAGWLFLKKQLKTIDILHTVSAEYSSILGSYWSKKSGIKHVAQLIGSDINVTMPIIKNKRIIKDWISHVDGIVCNSNALKIAFLKLYPDFNKPISVIYRGTDIKKFSPPVPDNRSDEITCLYVGGFADYGDGVHKTNLKGGYTVTKFWTQNETELKKLNIKLHLAGRNVLDNKTIINWHSQLLYKEQVQLSSLLSNNQILKAYQSSLILFLPSKQEGLPNAGVEAASCGCVIVGTNVGGIPEIIDNNKTGIIVLRDEDLIWNQTLIELLNHKEDLRRLSMNSRKKMEKEFDSSSYGPTIYDLYKSV
jgi:glycosyltransferase involved in cell wall biosynthesis